MKTNLFLVGAAKAGTTFIYHLLKSHPDIYGCPIKEPNFFGSDIQWNQFSPGYKKRTYLDINKYLSDEVLEPRHNAFIDSEGHYNELFREAGRERYLLDASTSYLYSKCAAKEIKEYNSDAKIVIILRDPVERTISHYKMDFANGSQKEKDIIKGIKKDYNQQKKGYGINHLYIELSLYYEQILRFIEQFPKENILILRHDSLKKNESLFIEEINKFLKIEIEKNSIPQKKQNISKIPRFPILKKLAFIKNILPDKIVDTVQYRIHSLYTYDIPIEITSESKDYIRKIVNSNWEKAKKLYENQSQ